MTSLEKLKAFQVDKLAMPHVWKARETFLNADRLRKEGSCSCAANRFYYSVFHIVKHFLPGAEKSHAESYGKYVVEQEHKNFQREALAAFSRAYGHRRTADYTPVFLKNEQLSPLVEPLAGIILRAMERLKIPRGDRHG